MNNFWETKALKDFSQEEWEAVCDGCGLCCFRKIVDGWLWWKKILNTRIACDMLNCETCRCMDYEHRFEKQPECLKLERTKIKDFKWLPQTCAYRLLNEGKPLPPWHPLITGIQNSAKDAGVCVQNPVNESQVGDDDWYDYVV